MQTLKRNEIRIRDPYILPIKETKEYYMYGTTDDNPWDGQGVGFDCYKTNDLENFIGPIPVFRPNKDFWGKTQFWAPEVHYYNNKYYMFASFKAKDKFRGTGILVSDRPDGDFEPISNTAITPNHLECLDGTFYIDEDGQPFIIFSHEWLQIHDGAICAMKLSKDLKESIGKPIYLFNASEAPWVRPLKISDPYMNKREFPCYVTDGPFIYKTKTNTLVMIWSSFGEKGYAIGIAKSLSGRIEGPWIHEEQPLWEKDGGHGMIFESYENKILVSLHYPNGSIDEKLERPKFIEVEDFGDIIRPNIK